MNDVRRELGDAAAEAGYTLVGLAVLGIRRANLLRRDLEKMTGPTVVPIEIEHGIELVRRALRRPGQAS